MARASAGAMPTPITAVVSALPATWRAQAAQFSRYGADAQARVLETVAAELEVALQREADAVLTLEQASAESSYSADHLRHLVADGTIPNAGRRGAPRIRRGDLPKRPGVQHSSAYDPDADALRLVQGAG